MKRRITIIFLSVVLAASSVFAENLSEEDLSELYQLVEECLGSGDFNTAITMCDEILKSNNPVEAYWYRGSAHYAIKNYNAAITDFTVVINRFPNHTKSYLFRGSALIETGMYHWGIKDYRQGIERGFDINTFLPSKNNRSDMWLCAAIYMEIVINSFLGDSASIEKAAKNEERLKLICDNGGITRKDVEDFFRANIKSLITGLVIENFCQIDFSIRNTGNAYRARLTYGYARGAFMLSYNEIVDTGKAPKEIVRQDFPALEYAMRDSGDFQEASIEIVREQARYIPAVVYVVYLAAEETDKRDALKILIDTLTNFCLTIDQAAYEAVRGIYARYGLLRVEKEDPLSLPAGIAYSNVLLSINQGLYNRINAEVSPDSVVEMSIIPEDPLYDIFSLEYNALTQ